MGELIKTSPKGWLFYISRRIYEKLSLLFLVVVYLFSILSRKADGKAESFVTESKKDMANIDAITSASIVPTAIVKNMFQRIY